MLLQVVGEHPQGAGGALQLEQGLLHVLLHRRARIGDVAVEVVERGLGPRQRLLHFAQRLLRFGREPADRRVGAGQVERRSLPISSNGILLTFSTISAICGWISLSVPRAVGTVRVPSFSAVRAGSLPMKSRAT